MCPRAKGSGGWLAFIFMPIIGAGIIFGVLHYRRRGGFG